VAYKVVIPSAGLGTRVGPYSNFLNKALVSIGDKPAISRVIEKFDESIPIIILLGYKGDMVEEVIIELYPKRDFEFIYVEKYKGEGSGLGHTLMQAKDSLQCPFIFIPNDTIVGSDNIDLDPNIHGNWVGYFLKTDKDQYNPEIFRCLELSENSNEVTGITGKGTLNKNIYCGISGVRNYQVFWEAMNSDNAITEGEVFGLRALNIISPIRINDWYDCGSLKYLKLAKQKYANPEHNILEKEDEAIWFIDNVVIKFSIHKKFIADRVERIKYLPSFLIPKLLSSGKYTYTYQKVEGDVIADTLTPYVLSNLLEVCYQNLWSKSIEVDDDIKSQCYDFYRDKSFSRLKHYLSRFEQNDDAKIINGVEVSSVESMLEKVDWDDLCNKPNWALFHGDFHAENILIKNDGSFSLLDWRQFFGEYSIEYGDTYYDLAKLKHGLLVNHGLVNKDAFSIKEIHHNDVFISIPQYSNLVECEELLDKWIESKSFSVKKVNLLTALIYLNICGLHEYPYSKFLYLYGQHLLHKALTKKH
jgi:NDP-sugar pyrophosphorylase family protein